MKIVYESQKDIVLRLNRGEHYKETMLEFLGDMGITSGFFYGLGGFLEAEVAFYDLGGDQEYKTKKIDGPLEVASLTGNIAEDEEGKPALHNHVVLGNESYEAIAGHLVDGVVGGTLELRLEVVDNDKGGLKRTFEDNETGLTLLE